LVGVEPVGAVLESVWTGKNGVEVDQKRGAIRCGVSEFNCGIVVLIFLKINLFFIWYDTVTTE